MTVTSHQMSDKGHSFFDSLFALLILSLFIASISGFLRCAGNSLEKGSKKLRNFSERSLVERTKVGNQE